MSQTVISVKVDQEIKEEAQKLAKSLGLTLSSLVNSYLRQVVVTRRVELFAPEDMTEKTELLIARIEAQLAKGGAIGPFDTTSSAIEGLKQAAQDIQQAAQPSTGKIIKK